VVAPPPLDGLAHDALDAGVEVVTRGVGDVRDDSVSHDFDAADRAAPGLESLGQLVPQRLAHCRGAVERGRLHERVDLVFCWPGAVGRDRREPGERLRPQRRPARDLGEGEHRVRRVRRRRRARLEGVTDGIEPAHERDLVLGPRHR
jgi:hypothetical protein